MSIKKYTLSEIGAFFKSVIIIEREKKVQNISDIWQGSNLTLEGLKEVLKGLGAKPKKAQGSSVAEVNKDWNRLATFMSKQGK